MPRLQTRSSADQDLCTLLRRHGTLALDDIVLLLNEHTWSQIFLAIDRLSRSGSITVTMQEHDYVVSSRLEPSL